MPERAGSCRAVPEHPGEHGASTGDDANFYELAWALDSHHAFTAAFAPLTFVGNHDVTRLASKLTDLRHLPHALAILLTVSGTSSIYYGDEHAFGGSFLLSSRRRRRRRWWPLPERASAATVVRGISTLTVRWLRGLV